MLLLVLELVLVLVLVLVAESLTKFTDVVKLVQPWMSSTPPALPEAPHPEALRVAAPRHLPLHPRPGRRHTSMPDSRFHQFYL